MGLYIENVSVALVRCFRPVMMSESFFLSGCLSS